MENKVELEGDRLKLHWVCERVASIRQPVNGDIVITVIDDEGYEKEIVTKPDGDGEETSLDLFMKGIETGMKKYPL